MTALHWSEHLLALGACLEAVAWARAQPDLPTAWQRCENGAWMLWLAGKSAGEPWSDARRPLVLAVCGCVRLGLPEWRRHFPDDDRPLQLLETAESWARGTGATPEHVRAAASAAAASAADAYAADASAAAYAADAYAAYDAAAAAAAAAGRANAVHRATLRQCADIVRTHYPEPPPLEVIP